jgi:hypothetical protein
MKKRDRLILQQGIVVASHRNGNDQIVFVRLTGEENRSPRQVTVHAMAGDCTAIKAALAQRENENTGLAKVIFG